MHGPYSTRRPRFDHANERVAVAGQVRYGRRVETIEIPLTQGKVAIIDAADWDLVKGYKWHAHRCGCKTYAEAKHPVTRKNIYSIRPVIRVGMCGSSSTGVDRTDTPKPRQASVRPRPATPSSRRNRLLLHHATPLAVGLAALRGGGGPNPLPARWPNRSRLCAGGGLRTSAPRGHGARVFTC
jgi:hypothetical protein